MHTPVTRRSFLSHATSALGVAGCTPILHAAPDKSAAFSTRGVVLLPFDLTLTDWPRRAKDAGLTHIALHAVRRLDILSDFVNRDEGQRFFGACRELGISVEYELHAMGDLLSRELFYKDRALFRQLEAGQRTPDYNCCPNSTDALDIIAEKAVHFAKVLRPTTHRYFYWPDDGSGWCHCAMCRELSASEQALLVENRIVRALRSIDPQAQLSHLAYHETMAPPTKVKPEAGIFLEFAPIARGYTQSIAQREAPNAGNMGPAPATHGGYLDLLDANLAVFDADDAQVLEYWLDASRFSGWTRPVTKLPWNRGVFLDDIAEYRKHNIRHVTTFAVCIDANYLKLHGDPQPVLMEYGKALNNS